MTTLPALPDLAALSAQAAQNATAALQTDQGDMFDNLWVKLANITGHPTPTPTAAAPITSTASSPSSTAAAQTPAPAPKSGGGVLGNLAALEQWAADLVTRKTTPTTTDDGGGPVSLEDLVFIVLGVLLIAAAVFSFVFTLKETQTVVKGATKAARGAVDSKLAPVVAAAVA